MAEDVGFEPTVQFPGQHISSVLHLTVAYYYCNLLSDFDNKRI